MDYLGFDKSEHFDRISLYRGDCMDLMRQTPDKYYDLCIVDKINMILLLLYQIFFVSLCSSYTSHNNVTNNIKTLVRLVMK